MSPSFFTIAGARYSGHRLAAFAALSAGVLLAGQSPARAQARNRSAEAREPAAVSGVVRDAAGSPQVGAQVELLAPNLAVVARTFTDDRGRYALPATAPGTYEIKASGALFLPTLRENLRLLASSRLVVNLTLNTFYQAIQWLPAQPRPVDEPKDDWNWTLRLSTNRPLLRVLDGQDGPGPIVLVSDGRDTASSGPRLTLRSGSNRFGEGGAHQNVEVERGHDDAHQLILRTDVGESDGAAIRTTAAYLRQLTPGTALTSVASFSDRPDVISGAAGGLQMATLRSAATMTIMPGIELEAGSEIETVHLGDTLTANHPFVSLTVQQGGTTVRYRMASSPDAESASELDRDATLSPRLTVHRGAMSFEQGRHQELQLQHQFARHDAGRWSSSIGYFHDAVEHPLVGGGVAVTGGRPALAAADLLGGNLLYDPATQLIAVSGQGYAHSGLLAIARDQISPDTWLSLRYAIGQALVMDPVDSTDPAASADVEEPSAGLPAHDASRAPVAAALDSTLDRLRPHTSPMLAASVGSTIRRTHTAWRGSYRWQPSETLTQVAPFDGSAPEAYLSFHVRQPIQLHYMSLHGMQAIMDVRNLLAQGYRPFLSQDGSMLYFAQAERCIEGGLSFSF